eukprot:5677022-Amphidinium_carterae.1
MLLRHLHPPGRETRKAGKIGPLTWESCFVASGLCGHTSCHTLHGRACAMWVFGLQVACLLLTSMLPVPDDVDRLLRAVEGSLHFTRIAPHLSRVCTSCASARMPTIAPPAESQDWKLDTRTLQLASLLGNMMASGKSVLIQFYHFVYDMSVVAFSSMQDVPMLSETCPNIL